MAISGRQQALEAVLERASIDRAFRKQLLDEPRRAILEGFGVTIPPTFNLKFIEKAEGIDALVVLPDFRVPSGELSDADLETVAGGMGADDSAWLR